MGNVINIILVVFLVAVLVSPIIFIPVTLIYNSRVKSIRFKVDMDMNNKNVKKLIRILKFGPLTKYDKKWEYLINTFNDVNKSKNIDRDLKEELYDVLVKRGCKESELRFNKKSSR